MRSYSAMAAASAAPGQAGQLPGMGLAKPFAACSAWARSAVTRGLSGDPVEIGQIPGRQRLRWRRWLDVAFMANCMSLACCIVRIM